MDESSSSEDEAPELYGDSIEEEEQRVHLRANSQTLTSTSGAGTTCQNSLLQDVENEGHCNLVNAAEIFLEKGCKACYFTLLHKGAVYCSPAD